MIVQKLLRALKKDLKIYMLTVTFSDRDINNT